MSVDFITVKSDGIMTFNFDGKETNVPFEMVCAAADEIRARYCGQMPNVPKPPPAADISDRL